jgi:hypothetical protein
MTVTEGIERLVFIAPIQPSTGVGTSQPRGSDGTVWAWGDNKNQQLGVDGISYTNTPIQVPGVTDVTQIASNGSADAYVLESDGTVWRWGRDSASPSQFPFPGDVAAISPDQLFGDVLLILDDGTVWGWRTNSQTFGTIPYPHDVVGANCGLYDCFAWGA